MEKKKENTLSCKLILKLNPEGIQFSVKLCYRVMYRTLGLVAWNNGLLKQITQVVFRPLYSHCVTPARIFNLPKSQLHP
jgi:hypothetical protein